MVSKNYPWEDGPELLPHTAKKHQILREYFHKYLLTRCQLPQQDLFKLVVVDGFSGAGIYKCGAFGSPLIFIDELNKTSKEINSNRIANNLKPINIECHFIFNDSDSLAFELLKKNVVPLSAGIKSENTKLKINIEHSNKAFSEIYPEIKTGILASRCNNVFFNLDQCGYSHVSHDHVKDIFQTWKKPEVLLTYMIGSAITYLSPSKEKNNVPLGNEILQKINDLEKSIMSKTEWIANSEQIIFESWKSCAPYVCPFSINNEDGWRYWLIHFAKFYTARQVYNNVLHEAGSSLAHFGRPGLEMLSFSTSDEVQPYLFDVDSRSQAKLGLYKDIPHLIENSGDSMSLEEFYALAYSETPAHSDDIHEMMMENNDIIILTPNNFPRQKATSIRAGDTIKLKYQKSFLF